jgi:hypothetical protein
MTTKITKEFVLSTFIYEIFKIVYNNPVLRFVIQSFPNHDKTIVEDNKFPTLATHLEDLLAEHKDDVEFVHDYIHTQVKRLIELRMTAIKPGLTAKVKLHLEGSKMNTTQLCPMSGRLLRMHRKLKP